MKSYRELQVYVISKSLAIDIHRMTLSLPKFELFEEASQVRRSSKSIAAMIVEGYGRRRYKADFIKYLVYAHAECDETIVHLDFLFETGSLTDRECYRRLHDEYEELSKKIYKLIHWVENNWNVFPSGGE